MLTRKQVENRKQLLERMNERFRGTEFEYQNDNELELIETCLELYTQVARIEKAFDIVNADREMLKKHIRSLKSKLKGTCKSYQKEEEA